MKAWLRENWTDVSAVALVLIVMAALIVLDGGASYIHIEVTKPFKPSPVKEEVKFDDNRRSVTTSTYMCATVEVKYVNPPKYPNYGGEECGVIAKITKCYGYTASYCDESYQK